MALNEVRGKTYRPETATLADVHEVLTILKRRMTFTNGEERWELNQDWDQWTRILGRLGGCYFCHRLAEPGTSMSFNGRIVGVCDVCRERGEEAEDRYSPEELLIVYNQSEDDNA